MAVPGSIVGIGKLITPGGQQGPAGSGGGSGTPGTPAWTVTTAAFTVPPINSTVVVTVADTTWAAVGEFVWVATAGGSVGIPMALQVTAKTAGSLTLLNPPTAQTSPSGDAGNLITTGSDSLLYLPPSALDPEIWSVRLRSFNAIGNPNFEVDQRNIFGLLTNPPNLTFLQDRWILGKAGTMGANWQAVFTGVNIPGVPFMITREFQRVTLTVQQASLGTSDNYGMYQFIEGTQWRELSSDVTSLSLLVRSSVAGLKFSVAIRDVNSAISLTKICTIPSANVWTSIALPNLPIPSGGTFNFQPGLVGYILNIMLSVGSSLIAPAADTWQNGAFVGAPGMSNFCNQAVGSTFDIAFVQHEPGLVCSIFQDKSFSQNLDECLRYYQKSFDQTVKPGTASANGCKAFYIPAAALNNAYGNVVFPKIMAKVPTVAFYSPVTGAINGAALVGGGDAGLAGVINGGVTGFDGMVFSANWTAGSIWQAHYTADTGW